MPYCASLSRENDRFLISGLVPRYRASSGMGYLPVLASQICSPGLLVFEVQVPARLMKCLV